MKQVSAIMLFYRHYCVAPAIITIGCCLLNLQEQDVARQLAIKLFTNMTILFVIARIQPDKLYYYYNLHISKRALFTGYFIADLLTFSTCLWLTTLMHR